MDRLALNVSEVAELIGVSKTWVYQAVESKRLPAIKLSPGRGPVRIRPADLQEFLAERMVRPA